jgi:hypothetical protein
MKNLVRHSVSVWAWKGEIERNLARLMEPLYMLGVSNRAQDFVLL